MIEFARKVRDKGGLVIGNNSVFTRSIANEKYILYDNECASGPEMHFAPTVTAIANPPFESEKDIYLDMLHKLSWGELFGYFIERIHLTDSSLAKQQFPMTFEEIRSGMVKGPQRIVTMNSGVYGWPDNDDLHFIHKFDARGTPVSHDFVTTVDSSGVRTEIDFATHESAVIVPVPANLVSAAPVNARIAEYDGDNMELVVNGAGDATLNFFVGTSYPDKRDGKFPDGGLNPSVAQLGDAFEVTVGDTVTTLEERDGLLAIPVKLSGQTAIRVRKATPAP